MNRSSILAWIASACFAAGAALLYVQSQEQHEEIAALQEQVQALEAKVAARAEIERAPEPPTPAAAASTAPAAPAPAPAVPEDFDPQQLLENMMQNDGKDESPLKAMGRMFQGEQGEKLARSSARMVVSMQYAELFRQLGLDPERQAQVQELLEAHAAETMKSGMTIFDGTDPAVLEAQQEAGEAQLRDALAGILSGEELSQFDAYQEELPARMLDQTYDQQLRAFSPNLPAETHELVKQVLVEEMQGVQGRPTSLGQLPEITQNQRDALDRALSRLEPELEPEQLADVSRFIEQQRDMIDASEAMLQGALEENGGGAPQ